MNNVLKYPGSKWNIAGQLVELIPTHHSYVEPYFGSGAVLYKRKRGGSMRRMCNRCLCSSCLVSCCNKRKCNGKTEECKRYSGFRQLSIFEPTENLCKSAPRASWRSYGLEDKSYRKKLRNMCQSRKYTSEVRKAAYLASPEIAEYLIKSVTKNKSYEKVEFDGDLGRICVCRTDFYGYRRMFYHLFDLEIRRKDYNG